MEQLLYRITRPIIKLFITVTYRPKIIGKENIPKKGNIILAGNHTNNLDCLVLINSTKRTIHFLGKHTLFKGIKSPIMKGMGVIPVDRTKSKNPDAVLKAKNILDKGGVIGIFPEGTINRTKETIMPFKMGAVSLAKKTDSYIVPFIITGKYKIFQNNLEIEFLKPIKCSQENYIEDNEILMNLISKKLERKNDETHKMA